MAALQSVIISRTDNLGDVVLTLPLVGLIKKTNPKVKVYFIGKAYTKALINACSNIDFFLDREQVIQNPGLLSDTGALVILHIFPDRAVMKAAHQAKIKYRVATTNRLGSWLYGNRLVNFSRRNSPLHEAQLNTLLLKPIIQQFENNIAPKLPPPLSDLSQLFGMDKIGNLPEKLNLKFGKDRFTLIFHPKSKGSAREWPTIFYLQLAELLKNIPIDILITGTANEGEQVNLSCPELFKAGNVTNLCGKLSLEELIAVINASDGLLACSTGPLHIAAALGKFALGIYPPMRPLDPGRWGPIGPKASYLVLKKKCNDCRVNQNCHCIASISVKMVYDVILSWLSRSESNSVMAK